MKPWKDDVGSHDYSVNFLLEWWSERECQHDWSADFTRPTPQRGLQTGSQTPRPLSGLSGVTFASLRLHVKVSAVSASFSNNNAYLHQRAARKKKGTKVPDRSDFKRASLRLFSWLDASHFPLPAPAAVAHNYTTLPICPRCINNSSWKPAHLLLDPRTISGAWRWFWLSFGPDGPPVWAMPGLQSHYPNTGTQTERMERERGRDTAINIVRWRLSAHLSSPPRQDASHHNWKRIFSLSSCSYHWTESDAFSARLMRHPAQRRWIISIWASYQMIRVSLHPCM